MLGYFKSKLEEFKTDEWVENGTECNKAVEILGRSEQDLGTGSAGYKRLRIKKKNVKS